MATKLTGRSAVFFGIQFHNPPLEVLPDLQEDANDWLDDPDRPGHYMSEMTAEGMDRIAMFWISDIEVYRAFRLQWCARTH